MSAHAREVTKEDIQFILAQPKTFENLGEANRVVAGLPANTSIKKRIELDSWRLAAIPDDETEMSANLARHMYKTYKREDYPSDIKYGRSLHEMVQAFAKTNNIDLAYDIVQNLRESVYEKPSTYLEYVIDLCLMEIYIETFDFTRALDVEISMLNNPKFQTLPIFQERKENLLNEIAFLHNRLGHGEDALSYLEKARKEYESKEQPAARLEKKIATNKGNQGRAYLLLKRYPEAEAAGRDVLKAGQKRKDKYMMALGYRLIGTSALHLGDLETAKMYLENGIALADAKNITTMQKFLYADYALVLEKLGLFEDALFWTRKQKILELQAQESASAARTALNSAEERARQSYNEVLKLQGQSKTLRVIIASLFIIALVFAALINSLKRTQKNLVASEKEAQAANKAKSEFLANMSHEIRTPMNGVLGMLEVLRQTNLDKKQMYYTNVISQSGNLLLGVISDILDLSKIEAGKLSLDLTPSNLKELAEDLINLHSANANEKNLDLKVNYDPNIPEEFIADGQRIGQILNNLIGNAIKFTPQGAVTVNVHGSVNNGEGNITFDVTDTGIGISEDKQALIFEKFSQAESSTTRKYGGTGLGLTISRRLTEAMNGELSVTSVKDQGTTFSVNLPLKVSNTLKLESAKTAVVSASNVKLDTSSVKTAAIQSQPQTKQLPHIGTKTSDLLNRELKFLIVESDRLNRSILTTYLRHPNVKLSYAENGLEAIQACKNEAFDMIYIANALDGMDTPTTIKVIRIFETQIKRSPAPIIGLIEDIITPQEHNALFAAGMDCELNKPIDRNELKSILINCLSNGKALPSTNETVSQTSSPSQLEARSSLVA